MRKTAIRLWSLLCATVFVLAALAGCTQPQTTAAPTDTPKPDESKPAEQTATPVEDVSWDMEGISWKKDTSPVTLSMFVDIGWYSMQSWGNDDVSKEITRLTGVSLEVSKQTDASQLSVMIAAANLPDLMVVENTELQIRSNNSEVAYAWDELIKQHAPEFLELIDPSDIANNTKEDGHFYTLKAFYSNDAEWADPRCLPSPGATGFSLRKDILAAIGNPKLESIEDLLAIYDQVHTKYPDMQIFVMNLQNRPIFAEWMGIRDWQPFLDTASGTVKHPLNNPEAIWLDYLKLMNGLYTKGYLNPENFAYQNEQFNQVVSSGNVFSVSAPGAGSVDYINTQFFTNKIQGEQAWVKPLTWKGESRYVSTQIGTGWTSLIISKQCKNPERAIRFAQFLRSPQGQKLTQWGIEGKHYTLNENKEPIPTGYYLGIPSANSLQQTGVGAAWYWQGSPLNESLFNAGIAKAQAASGAEGPAPQQSEYLKVVKESTLRIPVLSLCNPVPNTDEATINTKITALLATGLPELYMAKDEAEVEAKWKALYQSAKDLGMDKLEAYYNAQYQKYKDNFAK